MSTTSIDGWIPPTVQEVNFSDCTAAAQWLTSFINTMYKDTNMRDSPITMTYDYIASFVPSDMDQPSLGQAIEWYQNMTDDSPIFENMLAFPVDNCSSDVCQTLHWEGDSDLAGIGVMFVYYLAASLATTYFFLLVIDQQAPFRHRERLDRRWNGFLGAFRESLATFIDAALLFSISMLIAATYRHTSARIHPDKTHSVYGLTNATYMGIFTVFPPLLLQIAAQEVRRLRIRLVFWFFVIAFAVIDVVLYYTLLHSGKRITALLLRSSALADVVWETDCEPTELRNGIDIALIIAEILLFINFFWWVYRVLPSSLRTRLRGCVGREGRHKAFWDRTERISKLVNGGVCCATMWALLGLFTRYRIEVESRMGDNSNDAQWSFGQVLALATWVPVAIDLLTIYIYGPQDALGGKVSERFRVVKFVDELLDINPQTGERSTVVYRGPRETEISLNSPPYIALGQDNAFANK